MKTRLLVLIAALALSVSNLTAQYCGNSGSAVCTSTNSVQQGFFPPSEDIPCINWGAVTSSSFDIKNYDTITYNGITILVDSMRIDSISNLPNGICWATASADNTLRQGEHSCIRLTGTTYAPVGQYKLKILVRLWTNIGIIGPNLDLETIGQNMYIRLKPLSANCPAVDTTQTNPWNPGENIGEFALVHGRVYYDANQNNVYNNGEIGFSNIRVNVGSTPAITNASGNYYAYVYPGTYTTTPIGVESGQITFPSGGQTVNAAVAGQEYIGGDFAATIPPTYCEGEIGIVNQNIPPRPGFTNTVRVHVRNTLSPTPLSFTLRLNYTLQNLVSTTQAASNTGANYIEWNVSNLSIGTTWSSDITFSSPSDLTIGTLLTYEAATLGLTCANMDTAFGYQIAVVGSYDPNDKAVSPIGYSDHHGINPTQVEKLTYKIRFQNTGTFLAEKVVIVDTISSNLDLTTLQVLSASHNYDVAIGDDRAVKFVFNHIMLPDSNSNEPESHGYVQYSIKLNPSLAQNTQVLNKADIYFDFNEPIRTNTAYNTIDFTTGIKHVEAAYNFNLFPNPTTGNVQLTADEQLVGKQLKVTDISGRVLLERIVDTPVMTIQLSDFANGVYLLQIEGTTRKIVKE